MLQRLGEHNGMRRTGRIPGTRQSHRLPTSAEQAMTAAAEGETEKKVTHTGADTNQWRQRALVKGHSTLILVNLRRRIRSARVLLRGLQPDLDNVSTRS